jgi:hypothetical protein
MWPDAPPSVFPLAAITDLATKLIHQRVKLAGVRLNVARRSAVGIASS